jgi:hypothetical protein
MRAFISALKLRRCLHFIPTPFEGRDFTPYSLARMLGSSSQVGHCAQLSSGIPRTLLKGESEAARPRSSREEMRQETFYLSALRNRPEAFHKGADFQ